MLIHHHFHDQHLDLCNLDDHIRHVHNDYRINYHHHNVNGNHYAHHHTNDNCRAKCVRR